MWLLLQWRHRRPPAACLLLGTPARDSQCRDVHSIKAAAAAAANMLTTPAAALLLAERAAAGAAGACTVLIGLGVAAAVP
jgi:hypothetical protein